MKNVEMNRPYSVSSIRPMIEGKPNIRRITSALMPSIIAATTSDGQHAQNAHQPAVEPEDQRACSGSFERPHGARHLPALSMMARSLPIESGLSFFRSSQ